MPYLMTPVRLRLRKYADRLMEATHLLDKPTCYLEGERAARYALAADRMLEQLYVAPKPAKASGRATFGVDDDDMDGEAEQPSYDDLEAWQNLLFDKLLGLKQHRASQNGQWPNGAPYVEGEPEPEGASPFDVMAIVEPNGQINEAKRREVYAKARVWYAETHERGWETYDEAEKAEVIARIEEDWDKGRLSTSPPLRKGGAEPGGGGGEADGGGVPPTAAPSVISQSSMTPPPLRKGGEEEGPSIRIVESIFAPSGPFGKRPCGCAISAPKCKGPCPLAP